MKHASLIVFTLAVCMAFPEMASAQRGRPGINQTFRFLGNFQSAGYHWRNPGPSVGYYNPYSPLNSTLHSGGLPQGARSYVPQYAPSQNELFEQRFEQQFESPAKIDFNSPVRPADGSDQNVLPPEVNVFEKLDEPTEDDSPDLEDEVNSILDGFDNNKIQNQGSSSRSDAPRPDDATRRATDKSGWPGFFEFGSKKRKANQPQRRKSQTAKSVLTRVSF